MIHRRKFQQTDRISRKKVFDCRLEQILIDETSGMLENSASFEKRNPTVSTSIV